VGDRVVHVEVLQVVLFVGDDDVDVVLALQAVVHDRQETVAVRREVDADHLGALVGNDVEEARVLVGETVVVLSPDRGREQDVERGHLVAPLDLETLLDPLAVLVDHRVDDVDERLVAVEHAMATRQHVALEPTFDRVLREHLHDPTRERQVASVLVLGQVVAQPHLLACLVHLAELVWLGLVGAEETEVLGVLRHDVAQPDGHVGHAACRGDAGVDR
jgi:hypothetical protein